MNLDIWTVSTPHTITGLVNILDSGGNPRGNSLPLKGALEIVEMHNMGTTPQYLQDFHLAARNFLMDSVPPLFDTTDTKSLENYWAVISLLADSLTAQLEASFQVGFIKLKSGV